MWRIRSNVEKIPMGENPDPHPDSVIQIPSWLCDPHPDVWSKSHPDCLTHILTVTTWTQFWPVAPTVRAEQQNSRLLKSLPYCSQPGRKPTVYGSPCATLRGCYLKATCLARPCPTPSPPMRRGLGEPSITRLSREEGGWPSTLQDTPATVWKRSGGHLKRSLQPSLKSASDTTLDEKWWVVLQCSAVQCSAVQCSAVQCNTVQCSEARFYSSIILGRLS